MKNKIKKFLIKSSVAICVLLVISSIVAYAEIKLALYLENLIPVYLIADVNVPRVNKPITVEDKIRAIAKSKNFQWTDYLIKLAKCESKLDPLAIGDNGNSRGLFQIHKKYHPEVSTLQAFNIEYATSWTIDMINAGKQGQWTCDRLIAKK